MRKDVPQHHQIIVIDPFRLAVVTAINDAVAMLGHQQMKDALVEIAIRLAESVLNRHILTIHPLIESTAASTSPIIKIFFVIIVFFFSC